MLFFKILKNQTPRFNYFYQRLEINYLQILYIILKMRSIDIKKKPSQEPIFVVNTKSDSNTQKQQTKILNFYHHQIILEEQYKIKNKEYKNLKIIPLTNSTKYQVIWKQNIIKIDNDIGIKLIFNDQQIFVLLPNIQQRIKIRNFLATKINHFGFHQYFKTTGKIGQGSFASVYTTKKIQTGITYAVKAIPKGQNKQQEAIRLQIKILRRIEHQNIIQLKQVYQTQNSIYLLFNQLDGPSLDGKILNDSAFFTHQNIKKIIEQIFRALCYLHSVGIFHRDLKLENIKFVDKDCTHINIIDFGLADLAAQKKYLFMKCGTPGYVAPEILTVKQGDHIDPICDVFSVGVIMYIMITKKHLFDGKNDKEALSKNKYCQIESILANIKHQPPYTISFLKKCLQKNPKNRITSHDALNHQYFGYKKSLTNTTPSDFSNEKQSTQLYLPKNQKLEQQQKSKGYTRYLYYNTNNTGGSGQFTPRLASKQKNRVKGLLQKIKSNPSYNMLRRSIEASRY